MKKAEIVLLVYDITNKKSFDELEFWYNQVIENCSDSIDVILLLLITVIHMKNKMLILMKKKNLLKRKVLILLKKLVVWILKILILYLMKFYWNI